MAKTILDIRVGVAVGKISDAGAGIAVGVRRISDFRIEVRIGIGKI